MQGVDEDISKWEENEIFHSPETMVSFVINVPQQKIHIFSRLCLFASLFLKCKMLKIKGVSITLTEAKYFNVVGILTSQHGPKAIFVMGKKEGQTSILPHTFIMHAYSNFILFLTNSLIGIESKH